MFRGDGEVAINLRCTVQPSSDFQFILITVSPNQLSPDHAFVQIHENVFQGSICIENFDEDLKSILPQLSGVVPQITFMIDLAREKCRAELSKSLDQQREEAEIREMCSCTPGRGGR